MKSILFAASESVPFIKTGGLADVVGALPKYLDKAYLETRVILPRYLCMKQQLRDKLQYKLHFEMDYAGGRHYVGVLETVVDGIAFYFIDNEHYFSGEQPYGNNRWDVEKFIFFDLAVLRALPLIGFKPDIIHCHDWQTGLIPVYLKDHFRESEFYRDIKSVMTIHNLKFQGIENTGYIQHLSGLSWDYFTYDKLLLNDDANMLKGGLTYADALTTVSTTYAEEIKTPFYGEKLDGLLRARAHDLRGIVNGIDYEEYNPLRDRFIEQPFTVGNFAREKGKNKQALQAELGLEANDRKFLIGIVSRLTDQKGMDLVTHMMDEICQEDIQVVVLGTGEPVYEEAFRHFQWKYPDRVAAKLLYSEELSRKIYAAADAFLMPSLFEPCGLSQLISLRYGTLPIVRETGGLKDTVQPYNHYEDTGTGFSFANYNAHDMFFTIKRARDLYRDQPKEWNRMVERAMQEDYSWSASARKYQEMYDWLSG